MNSDLNSVITIIVIGATVTIFLYSIWLELRTTEKYRAKFNLDVRAIERLEQHQQNQRESIRLDGRKDKDVLLWLSKHLDGQFIEDGFVPRMEQGTLVLLSFPTILNSAIPRSSAHFAPMLLTALGILGTFVGVAVGLSGISLETSIDAETLIASSTELLNGMRTAFFTSVVGMTCAISAMLILAWGEKSRQNMRDKLRHRLNNIAHLETVSKILSRFDTQANRDAAIQLQNAAEMLSGLRTLTAEHIGQQVALAIQPTLHQVTKELVAQRKTIEAQRQTLLSTLIQELRVEVIEPVTHRLDESANLTRSASEAVLDLKNELGSIAQQLASSIQTIQQFQSGTLNQLQSFAQNLQSIFNNFQSETQGVLTRVADDIHQAVDQSIAGMESQRTAFEASAYQASEAFKGIREDLQAVLETQSAQQQTILKQAYKAFTTQTTTLTVAGQEAAELMDNARESLTSTLSNIDGMLQNTRNTVQEELEHFRLGYQEALNTFFTQQNDHLSGLLDKQREGLSEVVQELRQVFQEDAQTMSQQIVQSMDIVQHTAKVISNLANTTGLTTNERWLQLKELTATLGNETERIEQTYRQIANQLCQNLQAGNEQLTNYLERANEVYNRRFEDVDLSAVKVCTSLNEVSHGLMSVAEYLVAAADELNNKQGGIAK